MAKEIFSLRRKYRSLESVRGWEGGRNFGKCIFIGLLVWMLLLLFVPWQQTSMGVGRVVAYSPTERRQDIDAPLEGRLGRWFVHEGSHVEAGDPIVEISDNDPEVLNRLSAEKSALQSRLSAAQMSAQTALINLDRQKSLSDQGLSSRRSYELAKLEHAKYLTDVANSKGELVRIEGRLARQNTQFVKAPRSGTILRRTSGESSVLVKSGETLATLVPDTQSRAVEIWIGGNDVALIGEGQKVRLQFEGWPAIQFSGWPSVAVGTFAGRVAVIDAADSGEGRFRVLIIPDLEDLPWPASHYLRQGIRVQGWILMGRVKLGYELWRRFNGFPPALPGPADKMSAAKK